MYTSSMIELILDARNALHILHENSMKRSTDIKLNESDNTIQVLTRCMVNPSSAHFL